MDGMSYYNIQIICCPSEVCDCWEPKRPVFTLAADHWAFLSRMHGAWKMPQYIIAGFVSVVRDISVLRDSSWTCWILCSC